MRDTPLTRVIRARLTPEQVVAGLALDVRTHPGCLARLTRLRRAQKALALLQRRQEARTPRLSAPVQAPALCEVPALPVLRPEAVPLTPEQARLQALRARIRGRVTPSAPEEAA